MIVPFPFICVIRYHKDSVCFEWCFKFRFKATLGRHFFFIEVPVPSQKCEWSCIHVYDISILHLSMILILDFGTVPAVVFFYSFV
jgi:hypothetical protein